MVKLEKKRYLQIRVEFGGAGGLGQEEFKYAVYEAVFSLLGEQGASKAGVQVKKFDGRTQVGVVKCSLGEVERVIAALAGKTSFRGNKIALRLQRISGVLSKLA